MSKKRIVTTARGLKLDLDALKASQPQAKPIITGRGKQKPAKLSAKNVAIRTKSVRINATVPAKRPKPTAALVAPATAIVEKPVEVKKVIEIDVANLPTNEAMDVVSEAQKTHRKNKE